MNQIGDDRRAAAFELHYMLCSLPYTVVLLVPSRNRACSHHDTFDHIAVTSIDRFVQASSFLSMISNPLHDHPRSMRDDTLNYG